MTLFNSLQVRHFLLHHTEATIHQVIGPFHTAITSFCMIHGQVNDFARASRVIIYFFILKHKNPERSRYGDGGGQDDKEAFVVHLPGYFLRVLFKYLRMERSARKTFT